MRVMGDARREVGYFLVPALIEGAVRPVDRNGRNQNVLSGVVVVYIASPFALRASKSLFTGRRFRQATQ